MSNAVLIIGESGTGKSCSIRSLPHSETFVLSVVNKPLPFKGSRKQYTPLSPDGLTGNYYYSDNHDAIKRVINLVNKKRPEIKYFILDDFGFTIANSFIRKALVRGYDKFSELAANALEILDNVISMRDDLFAFVMMHTDIDAKGLSKPKTVGKMIDQHVLIEGKFTYVLHSFVSEGSYKFITNNDGSHMAKSPMELFEPKIDNDLMFVVEKINEYLDGEI